MLHSSQDIPRDKLRNSSMDLFAVSRTGLESDVSVTYQMGSYVGVFPETGSDAYLETVVDRNSSM